MKFLNLDKSFEFSYKRTQSIPYELFTFPGGEKHIKLKYFPKDEVTIINRIISSDGVMECLLAKDALDRLGIEKVNLFIPYIPYARQDRLCDYGESFSLKVFTNLINSANFAKVTVVDPHSDVSVALIDRCKVLPIYDYVQETIDFCNENSGERCYIISPDAGAIKKIQGIVKNTDGYLSIIKCDKTRDPKDGKLTGFEVYADDLNEFPCLIVDDICDGGGTFLGLANKLIEKNAGHLYLYTTHGIYSKGFEALNETFEYLFCTNSFKNFKNDQLIQYQLNYED